jgi:zinc transport system ATP-binding protein
VAASPDQAEPLITATDVGLRLAGQAVLQGVNLTIPPNKVVSLIGPNGAGKTTLVRVLLGLIDVQQGTVARKAGLTVGYMPQRIALHPALPLTVMRFLSLSQRATESAIDAALTVLRIEHLQDQQLATVSGGELQRVLLARAMLGEPQLLILDEPAQGVDLAGQAELYRLIGEIRDRSGCGVLMISHDLHLVMSATDEVVCLNHHVCCHGEPEHVSSDPAFLELFGASVSEELAVYTHHHNHEHDISGNVKSEPAED